MKVIHISTHMYDLRPDDFRTVKNRFAHVNIDEPFPDFTDIHSPRLEPGALHASSAIYWRFSTLGISPMMELRCECVLHYLIFGTLSLLLLAILTYESISSQILLQDLDDPAGPILVLAEIICNVTHWVTLHTG